MAQHTKMEDGLLRIFDCPSWFDFQNKLHSILSDPDDDSIYGKYIFRGQSCSRWSLTSSFDRAYWNATPVDADRIYDTLITQFRSNYLVYGNMDKTNEYLPRVTSEDNKERFEMLAQHYGIPTKLIDFSYSPYIAAFFAFSNLEECTSGMVSIWAMRSNLNDVFSKKHLKIENEFYHGNARRLSQLGVFARNGTETRELERIFRKPEGRVYFKQGTDEIRPALFRFDLPESEASIALRDLDLMRINSMSVFPGIEGVVSWINKLKVN